MIELSVIWIMLIVIILLLLAGSGWLYAWIVTKDERDLRERLHQAEAERDTWISIAENATWAGRR